MIWKRIYKMGRWILFYRNNLNIFYLDGSLFILHQYKGNPKRTFKKSSFLLRSSFEFSLALKSLLFIYLFFSL